MIYKNKATVFAVPNDQSITVYCAETKDMVTFSKKEPQTFVEKIIGGRITDITRVCDLVSLKVLLPSKKAVYIHIQTFFRVLWKDRLIISSEDMYRCAEGGDKENFKWDVPGNSVFDDSIKKHLDIIKKSHIIGVTKQTAGDLIVYFVDWDSEDSKGTLKVYKNGKATKIADDASSFTVTPDGRVLYLYDYSAKYFKGELREWANGKSRKIDDDVMYIIPTIYFRINR